MAEEKKDAPKKKKSAPRKKKSKGGILGDFNQMGKIEVLIVGVFLLSFFVWGVSKCNQNTVPATSGGTEQPPPTSDAAADAPESPGYDMGELNPLPTNPNAITAEEVANPGAVRRAPATPPAARVAEPNLYVTLADLKVRKGPSLDSAIVVTLPLHEQVYYGGKRSDFRQKINIGTEHTYEPWVYIKTQKGLEGWVYGAGVHYYKWDRLADPIPPAPQE